MIFDVIFRKSDRLSEDPAALERSLKDAIQHYKVLAEELKTATAEEQSLRNEFELLNNRHEQLKYVEVEAVWICL